MIGDEEGAVDRRALISIEPSLPLPDLASPDLNQSDRARVDHFLARASADATLRAYRSDWRLFTTCDVTPVSSSTWT